jgi:predicted acyl esterase
MSGAYPVLTRNLNTGGDLSLETKAVVAHQTVYHQPRRLSFVTLPIVDRPQGITTP